MISEWKKKVVQSFESCVDEYDQYSAVQNQIAQNLSEYFPEIDKLDILEIGCGTGMFTQCLLNKYKNGMFRITDVSEQMVEHARAHIGCAGRVDQIDWSVMDGENPAMDRHYDLIVGNMVFQWFEDVDTAFVKLRSLLKPGGVLLYSVPAPTCFKEWRSTLSALSLPVGMLDFKMLPGVVKEEDIAVRYKKTLDFLQSLKKSGADTPRHGASSLSRADLLKACDLADKKFHGQITWRILYGRLGR